MAMKLYDESNIRDIADAIREKNGTQNTYKVSEMAQAIEDLSGGDAGVFFEQYNTPTDLSSYDMGDVVNLRANAFSGFHHLTGIRLPDGLRSIGNNAFSQCSNLTLSSLPSGLTTIGSGVFLNCTNLALTSLPAGLTSIGNSAFSGCRNLALTSLPAGLTSIDRDTFYNCTNLALTSLPDGITTIGDTAFRECKSISLISLPAGLTSIGYGAFQSCSNLKTVICNATNPPTSQANIFQSTHADLAIYVPDDSVAAYQSATNWSTYAAKIHPLSDYNPS